MKATVVIATHNRPAELTQVLRSLAAQSVPVEVVVCDDASENAQAVAMAVAAFPQARLLRSDVAHGPSHQRNRGIEAASCEIVFAPDDDSIFVSPRTIEQTLGEFDSPRVAAVGIPYVNVRVSEEVLQRAPDSKQIWAIHAFVGAAHAVRRSAFLSVGGYREHFFYMGEEGDLCLRLLAKGWVTRAGTADPVHHMESRSRVSARADFCGPRNEIRFALHNVPLPWLPVHLAGNFIHGIRQVFRSANPGMVLRGMVAGYADTVSIAKSRSPVPPAVYLLYRRLKTQGPLPLRETES